jgi:hypothetical protein
VSHEAASSGHVHDRDLKTPKCEEEEEEEEEEDRFEQKSRRESFVRDQSVAEETDAETELPEIDECDDIDEWETGLESFDVQQLSPLSQSLDAEGCGDESQLRNLLYANLPGGFLFLFFIFLKCRRLMICQTSHRCHQTATISSPIPVKFPIIVISCHPCILTSGYLDEPVGAASQSASPGNNFGQTRSQSCITSVNPVQSGNTTTTTTTTTTAAAGTTSVDVLQRAFEAMRTDGSQLSVADLVQASSMVKELQDLLQDKLKRKLQKS